MGAGVITGNERFLRENRQGAFVGRDVQEIRDIVGSLTGGRDATGVQSQSGLQRGTRFSTRAQRRLQRGSEFQGGDETLAASAPTSLSRRAVRREHQVAFDYQRPNPQRVNDEVATRLQRLLRWDAGSDRQVLLRDRTAVLRGTVATPYERMLAEKVALLEPGVDQVENELVVAPAEEPSSPELNSAEPSSPAAGE
jgi:osmotically-inducible protein OsmY